MECEFKKSDVSAIINGLIINPLNCRIEQKNIFIQNGLISEISDKQVQNIENVIDVKGMYVSAGFIDMHVHLREPGFEYKENIESGSKSAVAGGYTTILSMPNTNPVNDNPEVTKYIIYRAKKIGLLDVLPIGAMTKGLEGLEPCDYSSMIKTGIVAISDDGKCVQNDKINLKIFEKAKKEGLLIISHPEIFSLNNDGCVNEGKISKKLNLRGIPRNAENKAIERDIETAKKTGASLHIAHISTKEGVELIKNAKKMGLELTAEVTPHHLTLTENDLEKVGANAKMNPPLRTEEDRFALIEAVNNNIIDVIATDHAPHEASSKNKGLTEASFGISGLETMFPVVLKLVHDKKISIFKFVELLTVNPARILKNKNIGELKKGNRANITIWDVNAHNRIDANRLYTKGKNTPFHAQDFKGKVFYTIYDGKVVYCDQEKSDIK